MTQPQIWHYGMMARWMALFHTDPGPEGAYFQSLVETSGQPALDLGCGSGRLLIPMLKAGLEVEGVDYSADMLAVLAERAAAEGLSPCLYQQSMHELDLPRRYQTIYACGVIGLGGAWDFALEALRRAHEHLRSGGVFVFDYSPRWNDHPAWLSRLPENRHSLPDEFPQSGDRDRLPDGDELEIVTRTVEMDPLEDVATRQIRARLFHQGALLKEEIHTQKVGDFTKNELLLMLKVAGFRSVELTGDYSAAPATADHETLLFLAHK